ncbi:MAG: segregation and condensation protein A, partial [Gaiellaceae bacterium]
REQEEAAEELARRLAEDRRMKQAAAWLAERLAGERERFFRVGPAPLAPRPDRALVPQDPQQLAAALRALAEPPPQVSLSHMGLRFPPVGQFLARFRALLGRRRRFDFDAEVEGLNRIEQAVAFLALLELRKTGEVALEQAAPFAPIRVSRSAEERKYEWTVRSA